MNKSNINELSAQAEADNDSTAQNPSVSQPNANTNVVGSLVGQREIKFRAWDYFNDVMIYDSDDETDFKFYNGKALVKYVTEQHTVENGIDIDRPVWNQVDGPVMQYTGLKDKNGTEIYEGDIIKTSLSFWSYEFMPPYHPTGHDGYGEIDCTGTIQFKDSCFVFYCMKVLKETNVWHDEYNLTKHFINKYHPLRNVREVLGNIYENPELLQTLQ